jgi:5-hydroxyisourate hydrolase
MSGITTHVLDTSRGIPAAGIEVALAVHEGESWRDIARVRTDTDGRARLGSTGEALAAGIYRLRFETGAWLGSSGAQGFYPWIEVAFEVRDPSRHHHVPLLLSSFGYTTYRGS